jgi:hypothetical protein
VLSYGVTRAFIIPLVATSAAAFVSWEWNGDRSKMKKLWQTKSKWLDLFFCSAKSPGIDLNLKFLTLCPIYSIVY